MSGIEYGWRTLSRWHRSSLAGFLKTLSQIYSLYEQVLRVFENLQKHWDDMIDSNSLAALSEGGSDSVGETGRGPWPAEMQRGQPGKSSAS